MGWCCYCTKGKYLWTYNQVKPFIGVSGRGLLGEKQMIGGLGASRSRGTDIGRVAGGFLCWHFQQHFALGGGGQSPYWIYINCHISATKSYCISEMVKLKRSYWHICVGVVLGCPSAYATQQSSQRQVESPGENPKPNFCKGLQV